MHHCHRLHTCQLQIGCMCVYATPVMEAAGYTLFVFPMTAGSRQQRILLRASAGAVYAQVYPALEEALLSGLEDVRLWHANIPWSYPNLIGIFLQKYCCMGAVPSNSSLLFGLKSDSVPSDMLCASLAFLCTCNEAKLCSDRRPVVIASLVINLSAILYLPTLHLGAGA